MQKLTGRIAFLMTTSLIRLYQVSLIGTCRNEEDSAASSGGTLGQPCDGFMSPGRGMIQRGGQVVLHLLANVQQTTIQPIIEATVAKGALIHTDEYGIYAR